MSNNEDEVQWTEWGVRRTWGPSEGEVSQFGRDLRTARQCAESWPGTLVSRLVTAAPWSDDDRATTSNLADTDTLGPDAEMPYEFVALTQQRRATAQRLEEHFPHGYVCGDGQCTHNLNSAQGWAAHVAEVLHPDLHQAAPTVRPRRPGATRARR